MVVGVARIDLYIPSAHGLKDKRGVVRRVLDRVRHRFPVSAAEVDHLDLHQRAGLAFAVVSNDTRVAESVIQKVIDHVEGLHLAQILEINREILHL